MGGRLFYARARVAFPPWPSLGADTERRMAQAFKVIAKKSKNQLKKKNRIGRTPADILDDVEIR